MLRLLFAVTTAALLISTTFPTPSTAEQRVGKARPMGAVKEPEELRRFEAALPKLNLTPEQKPRIAALLKDVRASLAKMEKQPGTDSEKQARLKKVHKSAKERLKHILTVAQSEKLKTLMDGPRKTIVKKPR